MLELLPYLAAFLALVAVAAVAFARPEGVLWRAGLIGALAALGAGVAWKLAEGGDSALMWRAPAAFLIGLAAALIVSVGAIFRHVLNGVGARIIRG
jgi:hypothetical protein